MPIIARMITQAETDKGIKRHRNVQVHVRRTLSERDTSNWSNFHERTRVRAAWRCTRCRLMQRTQPTRTELRQMFHRLPPHAVFVLAYQRAGLSYWTTMMWCVSDGVKPGPHQQQCRSNVRLCCQKRQQCRTSFALKFRPFDKVERCFDIVDSVDPAFETEMLSCLQCGQWQWSRHGMWAWWHMYTLTVRQSWGYFQCGCINWSTLGYV